MSTADASTHLRPPLRWRTAAVRRVRDAVIGVAATGVHRVQEAVHAIGSRHHARWDTDGAYRRILAAALVALASTMPHHRAVAAALAALVAETTATGYRPRSWGDEDDDPLTPRWSFSAVGHRGLQWDDLQ